MLNQKIIEDLVTILKKDAKRALRMQVAGFPKPYYCSFLLRDTNWFNTWANSGSIYRQRSNHSRNVYCDMRVGSYRYDQTTEGGLLDNDADLESNHYAVVPIDDTCNDGLRFALWRLSEIKYREAVADYSHREAASVSNIDKNREYASFSKLPPKKLLKISRAEKPDQKKWTLFCQKASKWMSTLPKITSSWIEFDINQEVRLFVSTENRIIAQKSTVYSLSATLRRLTKEGLYVEQELIINCGSAKELPDLKEFKRLTLEKYELLLKQIKAKKIHSFSGPVLLYPLPAGLLIHEAIGHRLEGSRLLASGEGQTFKGQLGKRLLKAKLSIRDNPKQKKFNGRTCIGAYDFDDEGVESEDTSLLKDGVLTGFLTTRAAISKKGHKSNGHARTKKFQRPVSRMGVTIIESSEGLPMESLKEKLIEEIKKQGKPFGLIVYRTAGGETDTTSYDFQAFAGEIAYATLIYPNGKEVCVRGVDFVGTPLQALSNIIAVGQEKELDNGYCGAESGFLPVSTISPALLLSNLELQAKDEHPVTPYLLPKPKTS